MCLPVLQVYHISFWSFQTFSPESVTDNLAFLFYFFLRKGALHKTLY